MVHGENARDLSAALLALPPKHFADEAARFVASLSDDERGQLASALVMAVEATTGASVALLGLDSADPSLMSRGEVVRLFAHVQRHEPAAFRLAVRTLREGAEMRHVLGALFAPAQGSADTGRLGSDR